MTKKSNKKNLALGYLLPVLCSMALGVSATANAENHSHRSHQSGGTDGLYIGAAAGGQAYYDSYQVNEKVGIANKFDNNFSAPLELRLGYQLAFGNLVVPIELVGGYTVAGGMTFDKTKYAAAAAAAGAGTGGTGGTADGTGGTGGVAGVVGDFVATAAASVTDAYTKDPLRPTWSAGLRVLPGAYLDGSKTFSLHTIFGFEAAQFAGPKLSGDHTLNGCLFGGTLGTALRYEFNSIASVGLELSVTKWFSNKLKLNDVEQPVNTAPITQKLMISAQVFVMNF